MRFERDEIVGIVVSIAVATAFFGAMRYDAATYVGSLFDSAPASPDASEERPDAIVIEDKNDAVSLLMSAFSSHGKIEKLIIEDSTKGAGPSVEKGSRVTVHYVGMLQDGTVFDNSYEKGEPYPFTVGMGDVIEGWDQGLLGMQAGGQRILVVPPSLGYGDRAMGPIPAGSTLLFSVELISIE
jgi:FKBP-type peptidyl-prolyl cis-trans isomerase